MKISEAFKDIKFLKWMFSLSLPIALQNLIYASVNTMDTIMVGQLGEVAIASVGLANQVFFILSLMLFGISSGCNIFVSQFWGKRDSESIRNTMALSIIISMIPCVIITILALFTPQYLMRIFSNDKYVIEAGCKYLRIIALSYIPIGISNVLVGSIRTIERPFLPLVVSITSLVLNTSLNYILIFGKLSFPALGIEGAAIATVISRMIELLIAVIALYTRFKFISIRTKDFRRSLSGYFIKPFSKATLPVILNETIWGIGVALYSVIYSRMGTGVVAATNISNVFDNLFRAFFFGMGYAAGVITGKTIGEGKEALALDYGKRFNIITPIFSIALTVVIILLAPFVKYIYNVSESVISDATMLIIIMGLYAPVRNTNLVQLVGTLRSGGDTRFTLFIDTSGVWLIALPLMTIFGLIFKCNIVVVQIAMLTEEIIKIILVTIRVFRGKWVTNLVKNL